MGPEHAVVAMRLVDDDVAQSAQEGGPARVVRQYREVHHVWVRQDETGMLPCISTLLDVRIAIQRSDAPGARRQRRGGANLIMCQGFGGGDVERGGSLTGEPGTDALTQRQPCCSGGGSQHGHQVRQGLAGSGRCGDGRMVVIVSQIRELHLMPPWLMDARSTQCVHAVQRKPGGPWCRSADARLATA